MLLLLLIAERISVIIKFKLVVLFRHVWEVNLRDSTELNSARRAKFKWKR